MEVLYLIIALVWSILCLILFFKLWGMTNDVRELKEYIMYSSSPQTSVSEETNNEEIKNEEVVKSYDQIKNDLEAKQKEIKVTWNHKFNVGDIVTYKFSKKKLIIALILENAKEYRCFDAETKQLLSAVFTENELL